MQNILKLTKRVFIVTVLAIQPLLIPFSNFNGIVMAQESEVVESTITTDPAISNNQVETPVPAVTQPVTQGPQEPTGPENTSYTYNPETGLWENQYYNWDPVSKKTSTKTEQDYSYNPETGMWDTTSWLYAPETQSYKPQIQSTPPSMILEDQSNNNSDLETSLLNPVSSSKLGSSDVLNQPSQGKLQVTKVSDSNGFFDNFFDADISVTVNANSQSGNASVVQNTIGGSALTGNAFTSSNILNMVQSNWGLNGFVPNIFTENIQGDYFGDIYIDPSQLTVETSKPLNNDLVINSVNDVSIENNINLGSTSGNALVQSNTQAGDAVSGGATTVLNLMNIINSTISTGQSFIGLLNIYGNLEGDVLLNNDILDALIASNIPTSEIDISNQLDTSFMSTNENNHTVSNNILATASTGNASVGMNTSAGNATSGDANTNITVFNLVGSNFIAEKAILVFVNVQGTWVGFITNAPQGSSSALLGSNVEQNSTGIKSAYDLENNHSIVNNVDLSATTGSASVIGNTTAGGATSGNASVTANIGNISNSAFSLSSWFGMLFINIFGNWNGSFGTNTAFGNPLIEGTGESTDNNVSNPILPTNLQNIRIFSITAETNSSGGTSITSATPALEEDVPPPTVLAAGSENRLIAPVTAISNPNTPGSSGFGSVYWTALIALIIIAVIYRRKLNSV